MEFVRASTRSHLRFSPHLRSGLFATIFGAIVLMAVATLASVSPAELFGALFAGDPQWLIGSAALYAIGNCISAFVWREGLRGAGLGALPLGTIMRVHWICRGASELLPAQLGEIIRVAGLRGREETKGKTARIVGSVGVYKLIDGGSSVVIAVVVLALLAPSLLPDASAAIVAFAAGMRLLVSARRFGSAVAFQSAVVAFRIAALAALLVAYGAPASAALVLFSVMVMASLLPISPGGVGVREALVLPALALVYGMSLETALVVSVATQGVALLVSIAGALIALIAGSGAGAGAKALPDPVPVPAAAQRLPSACFRAPASSVMTPLTPHDASSAQRSGSSTVQVMSSGTCSRSA